VSRAGLLRWQWSDYAAKHRSRTNLLIHIVAVPLFQLATLLLVYGALCRTAWPAGAGVVGLVASLALQGRGHRLEAEAPTPFAGAADAVRRIVAEQWVTFPRFVLSGGWSRNLRAARPA
jgi:phage terminase small subunit